jgi:hypothetical protein
MDDDDDDNKPYGKNLLKKANVPRKAQQQNRQRVVKTCDDEK